MRTIRQIIFIASLLGVVFTYGQIDSTSKKVDRYVAFGPSTSSYKGDLNSSYSKIGGGINFMIIPERDKFGPKPNSRPLSVLAPTIEEIDGRNKPFSIPPTKATHSTSPVTPLPSSPNLVSHCQPN